MESYQYIRRIKRYAIISFLLPLIAINSCFLLYKLLGNIDTYFKLDWSKKVIKLTPEEYDKLETHYAKTFTTKSVDKVILQKGTIINKSFVQCPKNKINYDWERDGDIFYVFRVDESKKNLRCVKNYPFAHFLLNNFSWIEKILISTQATYYGGFAKTENPYLYGEVSISRTARYFPANIIFKVFIISSAIFLFFYWKNNLRILNYLQNKKIISTFSKIFFIFGVLSCIFLILHAAFLGLDFDSKLFSKVRRFIIIFFILFEILAQFYLAKNLFQCREKLKKYIHPFVLKLKITFVAIVIIVTLLSLFILALTDPSSSFKHILEWNYFSFLLIYYLLSTLLWRS